MTQRAMPVRSDHWRPDDRIYDGLLRRCVADADAAESRDGTPELMAGALILTVLAVVIVSAADSAEAAILICGVLAAAIFAYVALRKPPPKGDRRRSLRALGGAGRLPAGFLVHPSAWAAGMAEHVAHIPESQLRAAADMCHLYPGTVDDLLLFVGNLAIHVPATRPHTSPPDVDRRARALVRLGMPLLTDHLKSAPPLPTPPAPKGRKR
jgi:hypothetical protein